MYIWRDSEERTQVTSQVVHELTLTDLEAYGWIETVPAQPASLRRRIADAVVALGAHIDRDAVYASRWPTAA